MYLGLTGYNHESSAALVDKDGILINYYREEVLSRIKGDKSFPKRAIRKILEFHKLTINDLDTVAFYERPLTAFLNPLKVAALNIPKSLPLISHTNPINNIGRLIELAVLFVVSYFSIQYSRSGAIYYGFLKNILSN